MSSRVASSSGAVRSIRCAAALVLAVLVAAVCFQACGEDGSSAGGGGGDDLSVESQPSLFVLRNLARLHAERDSKEGYAEALAVLRRIIARGSTAFDDLLNTARVLARMERGEEEALVFLDRARETLEGREPPPAWWYVRGVCLRRLGRAAEALRALETTLRSLPEHPQVLFQCARAAEEAGDPARAAALYRRLIASKWLLRPASYRLSIVLRRLGRSDEAAAALKLFQSQPKDVRPETEICELLRVRIIPEVRGETSDARVALVLEARAVAGIDAFRPGAGTRLVAFREGVRGNPVVFVSSPLARTFITAGGEGGLRLAGTSSSKGPAADVVRAGDVDGDGRPEILMVRAEGLSLWKVGAERRLEPLSAEAALELPGGLQDARFFDADHDGDLDIIALSRAARGALLLSNDGEGRFERRPLLEGALPSLPAGLLRFDAHDLDQANDLDLVLPGASEGVLAALNKRDGTYERVPLPVPGAAARLVVEDFDADGAPDVLGLASEDAFVLGRNADAGGVPYRLRLLPDIQSGSGAWGITLAHLALDADADGDLDVLVSGSSALVLLRNEGGRLVPDPIRLPGWERPPVDLAAADLDGDGRLEVVACDAAGRVGVFTCRGTPAWEALEIVPEGQRDNPLGIGTVVEVHAGRLYQSRMVKEPTGLHLGLGSAGRSGLDGIFLRWPQGIRQPLLAEDVRSDPAGRVFVKQKAGLVASCPFLYGWDGSRWVFLTDVLGIAPLDEWTPPGTRPHLDPEEYVRIPGEALGIEEGAVRLEVTEELRETAYLDRAALVALDHPRGTFVCLDESTRQGAYDPLRVLVFDADDLAPPARVRCGGRDVLELVERADGRYLHGYREPRTQWSGWVERYEIEMEPARPAAFILLTGRIAWYDSTVAYALSQNGRTWGPLRLEMVTAGGERRTLVEDLGVPAGMDRTIVARFAPKALPAGTRLVLSGQHRFLWDRILLAGDAASIVLDPEGGEVEPPDRGRLSWSRSPPFSAELFWRGFSNTRGDTERHEQTYVHEEAGPDDAFPRPRGMATRYGDVLPLVLRHDDALVTLVPGDALRLDFPARPPAPGSERTWFLQISGWAKEAGYHNRTGGSIEPLPFRGMPSYPPPPESMRADTEHLRYLNEWQTRRVLR